MKDFQLIDAKISCELPPSQLIPKFQIAVRKLVDTWHKYKPNDSLSGTRKQDLQDLQSILHQYQQFSSEELQQKFWQGYFEGKSNRRTIKKSTNLTPSLLSSLFSNQKKEAFALGVKTGWQYARLKSYLVRIENIEKEQLKRYKEMMLSQKANPHNLDYTF